MDLTDSIAPKSDQLNAEDLIGGPLTFTIERVTKGSAEQPVNIHLVERPGRAYRPSKSMRRVFVAAWGKQTDPYAGRRFTVYRDPDVKFGGQPVGGIKISHLSHIEKKMTIWLTETRGVRKPHDVEPLVDAAPEPTFSDRLEGLVLAFARGGVTRQMLEQKVRATCDEWGAGELEELGAVFTALREKQTTVEDEFVVEQPAED